MQGSGHALLSFMQLLLAIGCVALANFPSQVWSGALIHASNVRCPRQVDARSARR